MSGMVEMSQSDFRNISCPRRFQYVESSRSGTPERPGESGSGGEYALREISGVTDGVDGCAGVFAGAGESRGGDRSWWSWRCGRTRLRRGTASMRLWLLPLLSVHVCSVRLLRTQLLYRWRLHRCWTVVSLGPSCLVLESWLLWPRRLLGPRLGSLGWTRMGPRRLCTWWLGWILSRRRSA